MSPEQGADFLHRRREAYERMRCAGKGGPVRRWRRRRALRRLVTAGPFGPPGGRGDADPGGAGVREPRRPLPRSPHGAAERPLD